MGSVVPLIRAWAAEKLSYWEQASLEMVADGTEQSDRESEQLVSYFLQDAGLLPKPKNRDKLAFPDLLASSLSAVPLRLERIFNVKNVNALVDRQELCFGKQLTLIYGENGAGKTGYARILGAAGFARGSRELLPNAMISGSGGIPKADIEISVGNSKNVINWTNAQRPVELSEFYVFDGNSAVSHLIDANSLNFSPRGLSILTKLAAVTDKVRERVRQMISKHEPLNNFLLLFRGNTQVARLIGGLGANTNLAELERLARLSAEEEQEIDRLDKQIAGLKLQDTNKQIERRKRELLDLESLIASANRAEAAFSEGVVDEVNRLIIQVQQRRVEVEQSGISRFKFATFDHIGSPEWRNFLAAAKALAELGQKNPTYPQADDPCLLCHQKLVPESIELIQSYWDFLRSDAQSRLDAAEKACVSKAVDIKSAPTTLLAADSSIRHLLQDEVPLAVISFESLEGACRSRRDGMIESLSKYQVCNPPPEIRADLADVERLAAIRSREIEDLRNSNVGQRLIAAEERLNDLRDRQVLNQCLASVQKYVEDRKWAAQAREFLGSTAAITKKYNELFQQLVTERYRALFEEIVCRFKKDLRVTIETKGQKGETVRQIALSSETYLAGYQVNQVLSDGEKRAVAIADFLTEVSLDESSNGIILDDPVTSLDNRWKIALAECLVEQASKRQVIIFTHDLSFLSHVKSHANDLSVECATHWVREEERPGFVYLNNSPVCEGDYRSADRARRFYAESVNLPPAEQESKLQQGFGALRTSYEALVVFEIFNNVVRRFQERIGFDQLKGVRIDPQLIEEVAARMGALSRHIEAHLHSDAFSTTKPTPDDLLNEIDAFEDIRSRQKQLKKS